MPFLCLALWYSLCYAGGMEPEDETWNEPAPGELEKYADRTRRSLIMKLADWQDRRSWEEFYRTYWRLIYSVAVQAGLREQEAWDVVQETVLTIAKQAKKSLYDPGRGSFKTWLWNVTRWRISDQFRQRRKDTASGAAGEQLEPLPLDSVMNTDDSSFEKLWEREWQENIMKAALDRVKLKVSPRQFQIFDYNVIRGMKAGEVHRKLGVSIAQVYLAKHRVGSLLNKEIRYLRSQEDAGSAPAPDADAE